MRTSSEKFHASPVSSYNIHGKKIEEYKNIKAAAKLLGIQPNSIRRAILGDTISAKDRYWKLGLGPEKISMLAIENRILETRKSVRRPVTQYNLKGIRIKTFDSITLAAKATRLNNMNISGALRSLGKRTAGGFLWLYGYGAVKIKITSNIKRKNELEELYARAISQYSLQGKRIAMHSSVKKAAKILNIEASSLARAATGRYLTCSGFYWRFGKGKSNMIRTTRIG